MTPKRVGGPLALSFKDQMRLAADAVGTAKEALDAAVVTAAAAFTKAKSVQKRKEIINMCVIDMGVSLMESIEHVPDEACGPEVQRTVLLPVFERLRRIGAGTARGVVNGSGGYFLDTVKGALGPKGSTGELAKNFPLEWFLWAMHVMLCSGEPVSQPLPEVPGGIATDPDVAKAFLWACLQSARLNKLQQVCHLLSRQPNGVESVMRQLTEIASYREQPLVERLRLSFDRHFGMHPDLDVVFNSSFFLSSLTNNIWTKLLESHMSGSLQKHEQPLDLEGIDALLYNEAVTGREDREKRAIRDADAAKLRDADAAKLSGDGGAAAGKAAMSVNALADGAAAGGGAGAGGGDVRKCYKCNSTGHLAAACPTIKCHGCGELGHMKSRCTKRTDKGGDNDPKGKGKGGVCVVCHEEGHYARDCPNKEEVATAVKAMMAAKKLKKAGSQGGGGGGAK